MTVVSLIATALFIGALVGGGLVAAYYEHRETESEELPERGDRDPFTGHVPVSPWAAPHDEDGAS